MSLSVLCTKLERARGKRDRWSPVVLAIRWHMYRKLTGGEGGGGMVAME